MPFDPLFGPPAPLPGWPEASTDNPFGSGLGPAYGSSSQSPRVLSAVERGIQPFSAAHLGLFAWAPPIFSLSATLANLAPSWPQAFSPAVNLPDRPFYGRSSDLAQLPLPASAVGQDLPGAAASGPSTPPQAIGRSAPPLSTTLPQPPAPTSAAGLDLPANPWGIPPDASAASAPARSVLFTRQPATLDLGARAPDDLDQPSENLGVSDWPLSNSGTPFLPPPPPSANSPEQMLAALRVVAPHLVDYFTKPLPPPPPFPSVPGKIPTIDSNPYAPGALSDAANLAALAASFGETAPLALARMADEAAPGLTARTLSTAGPNPFGIPLNAVLQRLKASFARGGEQTLADLAASQSQTATAVDPASTASADQIVTGPYGTLRRQLPSGWQANHLNQDSVYWMFIPRKEGFSIGMRGNIFTEPGTPHYNYHWSLEQFWDQYRRGGSLFGQMPTNADFGEALRQAVIAAGYSPEQASMVSAQAAAQRTAKGLIESSPVPRIPDAIWRRRRE